MNFTLTLGRGLRIVVATILMLGSVAHGDDLQDFSKLADEGEYVRALAGVNFYLLSHGQDVQAQFLKGVILSRMGKREDAIALFEKLTQNYPDYPEPYNNLAVLYAEQGQFDKARQVLEMAINTNSSYATAHRNLGDIYAKMASDAYDKALQVDRSKAQSTPRLALIGTIPAPGAKRAATNVALNTVPPKPAPVMPKSVVTPIPPPKPSAPPPPVVKPASAQPAVNSQKAVLETVEAWANAWSAKDVGAYLAFYATDFKTPNGESRAEWAKGRKERISRPASIRVKVESPRIKMQNGAATVAFRQEYKAGGVVKYTRKTLHLRQVNEKWRIVKEEAGQ